MTTKYPSVADLVDKTSNKLVSNPPHALATPPGGDLRVRGGLHGRALQGTWEEGEAGYRGKGGEM